jgi:hypothetical protein
MATHKALKIKRLLDLHKTGTVLLASWLEKHDISRSLQTHYRRSGWLTSVGTGAFKRPNDTVSWQGGLYAIQQQGGLPIHAGALTALSLQGYSQYLRFGGERVYLFSPRGVKLPAWFKKHDWGVPVRHISTSFLPTDLGLLDWQEPNFSIRISAPERAILECLDHAPKEFDLMECYQVMESLVNLRPDTVTQLLKQCTSVKAKRLFLYLAEKANHHWLPFVNTTGLDLGSGGRSLSKGGVYVAKYNLVVPRELASP